MRISLVQILIYLLALGIVFLLLGLVSAKPNLGWNKNDNPYAVENFSAPDVSSSEDVSGGASSLYGWGYKSIPEKRRRRQRRRCPHCENVFVDNVDVYELPSNDTCRSCDITLNKDIDKYVLKSSVPPCPNMDEYARKDQLPSWFNPDEWVRKSDIPPCPELPDMNEYVRKSEIPPCPSAAQVCPKCPVCPQCPTCPPCPPAETKVVEKVRVEKADAPAYLPQSWGSYYPQIGGAWTPKLSDTTTGFISPDVPMAGNITISRGMEELPRL